MTDTEKDYSYMTPAHAQAKTPELQAEATKRVRAILVDDTKEHLYLFANLCTSFGNMISSPAEAALGIAIHSLPLFRLITVRLTPLVHAMATSGYQSYGSCQLYNETARFIDECRRGRQKWPYDTPIGELPKLSFT